MPAPSRLAEALADRYRIERELGAGGMATVYLAHDIKHDRQVALKVLRPELAASLGSERFFREIQLAARLQHPHILPLHDSGEAGGFLYFVMPYVEGESLRDRLHRVGELPVHDAVRILIEVVDALAYAHGQGVVHRDIKPDNVMLSGRHALVMDFGVAKALAASQHPEHPADAKDRSPLTTLGVALGTPAYMAPEQAAADPHIDHRVDIYAVGVMGYELLAGRPPFVGMTSQQVLAAHVTQKPEPLSTHRPACPPALESVLMRCLEKRAADRWQSAEELLQHLEPLSTPSGGMTPTQTRPVPALAPARRRWAVPLVAALAAAGLLAAWFGTRRTGGDDGRSTNGGVGVTLQDRTQLTTTGQARMPAISADGKQMAYVTTQCGDSGCSDVVEVQDVGGAITRRVLQEPGAKLYWLQWSPDRRNLIAAASIGGRRGAWLLSALGGTPRYLHGQASFFAGGDSLLAAGSALADSIFWLRVLGLDGTTRDSIAVAGPAQSLWLVFEVPGTRWIVAALPLSESRTLIKVIDRRGAVLGQIEHTGIVTMRVSHTAIWVQVADRLVRTSLDPASGSLASHSDTLSLGTPGGDLRGIGTFDITADGATLVADNGTYAYDLRAAEWQDLTRSPLPGKSILQSSSETYAVLSPNGTQLAILQHQDRSAGRERVSLLPFGGGSPITLLDGVSEGASWGIGLGAIWSDSATLAIVTREAGQARLERVSAGGVREVAFTLADSMPQSFDWIPPGGWTWIPEDGRQVLWQRTGDSMPSTLALPDSITYVHVVRASPDGQRLVFYAQSRFDDSMRVVVASLANGELTTWHTFYGEGAQAQWLGDNTIILDIHKAHSMAIYHLTGPGKVRPIGEVRLPVIAFSVSRDMKRAIVGTSEYRGDIWMSRVVKR